jgi:hypothetical protein
MEEPARSPATRAILPIILIAAVVQGWALYALHHAIKNHHWPATDQRWLIALYLLALFVPVTAQLLVEHARRRAYWLFIALLALAFFYFGWHHGGAVIDSSNDRFSGGGEYFPVALVLLVLWLMVLPFAQSRLASGRWRVQYELLFAVAWRNKFLLAEATLFTGLFWLLLTLWQTLFHLLGIDYFKDLFAEPIFVYPIVWSSLDTERSGRDGCSGWSPSSYYC